MSADQRKEQGKAGYHTETTSESEACVVRSEGCHSNPEQLERKPRNTLSAQERGSYCGCHEPRSSHLRKPHAGIMVLQSHTCTHRQHIHLIFLCQGCTSHSCVSKMSWGKCFQLWDKCLCGSWDELITLWWLDLKRLWSINFLVIPHNLIHCFLSSQTLKSIQYLLWNSSNKYVTEGRKKLLSGGKYYKLFYFSLYYC